MQRKVGIILITLLTVMLSIGIAQAFIGVILQVTDGTNELENLGTIPLNTNAQITLTYLGSSTTAPGKLIVEKAPAASGPWTLVSTPFDDLMTNNEPILKTYLLDAPGYYRFTLTAGSGTKTAEAKVSVGPVLSEPATIAALGLSVAAIGIVIARKKPSKQ